MSVVIERITPGEYGEGGLSINYSFATTVFGEVLVASTSKGICFLEFTDDRQESLNRLEQMFPSASICNTHDEIQRNALLLFNCYSTEGHDVTLHVMGTDFQIKVWSALLCIPCGHLSTYRDIAAEINNPGAVRAVGTAIGKNPAAYIIPCHRVINSSGETGNYRWGKQRKSKILEWESSHKM